MNFNGRLLLMSLSAEREGKGAVEGAGRPEVAGGSGGGAVDARRDPAVEVARPLPDGHRIPEHSERLEVLGRELDAAMTRVDEAWAPFKRRMGFS